MVIKNVRGPCILATAFIRYVLVCHPTLDILTKARLVCMTVWLILMPFLAILGNLLHMIMVEHRFYIGETGFFHAEFRYGEARGNEFGKNCHFVFERSGYRILIETSLCLILPGILSGNLFFSPNRY